MSPSWSAALEYEFSRSKNFREYTGRSISTAGLQALANGSIDVLQGVTQAQLAPYLLEGPDSFEKFETLQHVGFVRLAGKLFNLPGGPSGLTLLAEERSERIPTFRRTQTTLTNIVDRIYPSRQQDVDSLYGEVTLPFFAPSNSIPLVNSLLVQASIRYDRYETLSPDPNNFVPTAPPTNKRSVLAKFQSTDYTVSASWAPVSDILIRASRGSGFLPPSLSQGLGAVAQAPINFPLAADPRRPGQFIGTPVPVTLVSGGNPNLSPERSKSTSVGVIFKPRFLDGLRFSMDYTEIRKANEITTPNFNLLIANELNVPSAFERAELTQADRDAGYTVGPVTSVIVAPLNISKSRVRAIDFQANYDVDLGKLGRIGIYAIATHQLEFRRKLFSSSSSVNYDGYLNGPLKWKGNAGFDWHVGSWDVSWNAQYYGPYKVIDADFASSGATTAGNVLSVANQGKLNIPSQVYNDISLKYAFPSREGLARGVAISVAIQNVFDTAPPVIAGTLTSYSFYGDPRLRRFRVTLRKEL